jgi:hypothetical protein
MHISFWVTSTSVKLKIFGSYYCRELHHSWLSRSHHFESFTVATMTSLTVMKYMCYKWPRICSSCRKHFRSFPHSRLITGFVTRLTRRVPLVEYEQLILRSTWVHLRFVNGVQATRSLVLCVSVVDRCLSFFYWPLSCLSFIDVRILITPLVSSNSSYCQLQNNI